LGRIKRRLLALQLIAGSQSRTIVTKQRLSPKAGLDFRLEELQIVNQGQAVGVLAWQRDFYDAQRGE